MPVEDSNNVQFMRGIQALLGAASRITDEAYTVEVTFTSEGNLIQLKGEVFDSLGDLANHLLTRSAHALEGLFQEGDSAWRGEIHDAIKDFIVPA